jgi:hypothetical protein
MWRRLQGPGASVPRRHRLRDVADRLRRGMPVDALHRQADEGAHADAGHRPRQPVYPGKDCGVIVDYNGMLKSLRRRWRSTRSATTRRRRRRRDRRRPSRSGCRRWSRPSRRRKSTCAARLRPGPALGAKGFARIKALRDAVEALYTTDEAKRRFEIMARQVFIRFKALLMEPSLGPMPSGTTTSRPSTRSSTSGATRPT